MAGMYPESDKRLILFWIFLLLLGLIAAGFFMPISMQGYSGPLIKIGLFALVLGGGYAIYRSLENASLSWNQLSKSDDDLQSEDDETLTENDTWKGFGQAFDQICQEYITLLRQTLVATCGGFYIERPSGVLELQMGDVELSRVDVGAVVPPANIIENVWKSRTAIIETKLTSGTYLPGMTEQTLNSLICVPVFWQETPLGVLVLGSNAKENFSDDDMNLLNRYGMLLARIMKDYHHGLKEEMNLEIYRVHMEIEKGLRTVQDERDAMQVFVNHLRSLLSFERLVLSIRHGDQAIVRYVYGPLDEMDIGSEFPLDEGLTGWIIRRNTPLLIQDMLSGDYRRPRFKKDEEYRHGMRCFLGIPLANHTTAWGALTLESGYANQFDEQSKIALTNISLHLEAILSRIYARGAFSSGVIEKK